MALTPPPTLRKSRNTGPGISGVMAGVLLAVILGAALGGGVMLLRRARGRSEANPALQPPLGAIPPAASQDFAAARALYDYLGKVQAQLREHDAAFERLKKEQVLSWNIDNQADIEKGRQIIRDFLTTNSRLTDTVQYGSEYVSANLDTAKVPPEVRKSALALYAKSQAPLVPLQLHVRRCDRMLGENALAVLDLLDLNWGHWHRDEATGRLDFDNTITLAAFKDYVAKIQAAVDEQKSAQAELAASQRRSARP